MYFTEDRVPDDDMVAIGRVAQDGRMVPSGEIIVKRITFDLSYDIRLEIIEDSYSGLLDGTGVLRLPALVPRRKWLRLPSIFDSHHLRVSSTIEFRYSAHDGPQSGRWMVVSGGTYNGWLTGISQEPLPAGLRFSSDFATFPRTR